MQKFKAFAKVNIFLKITGKRGEYHEILSRFMRVNTLYDELYFLPKESAWSEDFTIVGDFSCDYRQNTIYKAYQALLHATNSEALKSHLQRNAIVVEKRIPAFAGLGGGSSDAATFLWMCNTFLDLGLDTKTLATIGAKVGADVPFFVYGYESANVSGIGEIVEEFVEPALAFEIFTPALEISTPKVYSAYRRDFYAPLDASLAKSLREKSSLETLKLMSAKEANDLFAPALQEYEALQAHYKEGYYFSGSGSSFFKVIEDKK